MKINDSNIKKAIKYLNNNECIGIPTETVYGLAANAYSDKGTKKIFKLKGRPSDNPLIVHYYNIKDLEKDCETNTLFYKLYNSLCPGPITFILKLKNESKISKNVTNNKKTLGVRFPSHRTARILLKSLSELTDIADRLIQKLENKKNLEESIEDYQYLIKLNNIIEKKFQKDSKNISESTKLKIEELTSKKNEKKIS